MYLAFVLASTVLLAGRSLYLAYIAPVPVLAYTIDCSLGCCALLNGSMSRRHRVAY